MARGWILAIVGVGALWTATASAQPGARSLADRLGLGDNSPAADERVIHDPFVQPAAGTTNGPRAPRDAATNRSRPAHRRRRFIPEFPLTQFVLGRVDGRQPERADVRRALPYDPAELEAAAGRTQPPPARQQPARRTAPSAGCDNRQRAERCGSHRPAPRCEREPERRSAPRDHRTETRPRRQRRRPRSARPAAPRGAQLAAHRQSSQRTGRCADRTSRRTRGTGGRRFGAGRSRGRRGAAGGRTRRGRSELFERNRKR